MERTSVWFIKLLDQDRLVRHAFVEEDLDNLERVPLSLDAVYIAGGNIPELARELDNLLALLAVGHPLGGGTRRDHGCGSRA